MLWRWRLPLIGFVLTVLCAVPVYAAITGVISGTVTDPTGAVIPNATVMALNEATGVKQTAMSDGKGFYTFPVLDVGDYTVSTSVPGFESFQQTHIHIDANSSVRTDIKLVVGTVTTTETITSNRVQVETQNTQLGEVLESQQMTAVPLNGRNFADLLNLQPGVGPSQSIEASDTPKPSGGLDNGSISVNGGRGASNGYMINGGNTNDGVDNTAAIIPNLDAIQEFRVITGNFDAEYGNYSGSQVNVVTKNGTNQFHGSAFEFFRNENFNARGYTFSTPQPLGKYNQNIYGGTFGGPIKKDKVFIFGDYQGTHQITAATTSTVVPSSADLGGNLSDWDPAFQNYPGTVQGAGWASVLSQRLGYTVQDGEQYMYIPNPDTSPNQPPVIPCTTTDYTSPTGCVFPNDTIPKTAWDPAVPALLKYVQAPTGTSPSTSYSTGNAPAYINNTLNNTINDNKESARVDLNTRFGTLFGYYFFDNTSITNPYGAGSFPGWGTATQQRAQQNNVGLTTTFKNNSVNNFRFTYLRSAVHSGNPTFAVGSGAPSLTSLGFVSPWDPVGSANRGGLGNIVPSLAGVPTMSIGEAGSFGTPTEVQGRFVNTFQWLDSYMKVIGTHTYQFGMDYSYKQIIARNYYDPNGYFEFSDNNETGLGFADFLLGAEDGSFTQASPQILDSRANYLSVYAEDSWRARKDLSINYGLRYEITSPWYDTQNKLETIVPGLQSKVFPGAPNGWVFPGDFGVPRTLGPIKYNKFAPRFGFAYTPTADGGFLGKVMGGPGMFSLRGGAGLFYNNFQDESGFVEIGDAPYGLYYQASTQTMLSTPYVDRGTQHVELGKFPFAFPPTNVSASNPDNNVPWAAYEPLSSSYAVSPTNTVPYVLNYFLGVQRGLGRNTVVMMNYVGNQGRHLANQEEANPGNGALCLSLSQNSEVASGTSPCTPKGESNIYYPAAGGVVLGTRILPSQNGNIAFGSNPYLLTQATSNYNSLQMSLRHSSKIWDATLSYTFGRSFDDASSLTDSTNAYNPKISYGLSSYDVTHNFNASYDVHLPLDRLSGNRVVKGIIGGWAVSGITKLYTGTPVGISDSDDYSMTALGDLPFWTPVSGQSFILNKNPRIRSPGKTTSAPYFNPAFITSESKYWPTHGGKTLGYGLDGNVRRRFFHGPGSELTDLALLRDFHIHENHVIQLRMEAFDALNHANFGNPSGTSTSTSLGVVSSANSARIMQFAAKYHF